MNLSKLVFLSFFFSSILVFGCRQSAADWIDSFESYDVGETLGSLGYSGTGPFEGAEISAVGVNGSQGFEIGAPQFPVFPFDSLFLPNQPGLQNPGDSLIFQVDMQMQNGLLAGTTSQALILDLVLLNPGGGFVGGRIHRDGTLWNQYQPEIASTFPFSSEFGPLDSVSELGFIDNSAGEWSDWVTLQLLISQTGTNSFDLTTNVLDLSGTTLNSAQVVDLDLSEFFANGELFVSITTVRDTWEVLSRMRFDNIVYSVNSAAVPEPSVATFVLIALVGFGFNRRKMHRS